MVHFANGTVVKLAKIPGSSLYKSFLQLELIKKETGEWTPANDPKWLAVQKQIKDYAGGQVPYGDAILAEMVMALREASEAVLGKPLPGPVVFSLPYVSAWEDDAAYDESDILKAGRRAGLKIETFEHMEPDYLGEASAVLGFNNLRLCPDRRCYGPEFSGERSFDMYSVYFIRSAPSFILYSVILTYVSHCSSTNQSLYTSTQQSHCFWTGSHAAVGTINPEFGLDQRHQDENFWKKLEDHLVLRMQRLASLNNDIYARKYLVLVAGEGAENHDLLDATRRAMTRIAEDPVHHKKPVRFRPSLELLVSKEPTYAAAMGAAFWRRTAMDASYCRDYYERTDHKPMSSDDMDEVLDFVDYMHYDDHDEL